MSDTMKAVSAGRVRRRPKTFGEGRVCGAKSCSTRLSRYNRSELCFNHAPARFPRMRGEFSEDYAARHGA